MRQKVKSNDNSELIYELYLATKTLFGNRTLFGSKNVILATKCDLNGLGPYFPKIKVIIWLNLCNNNDHTLFLMDVKIQGLMNISL